jgi:phosphohistidine phosphatase
MILYIMRHAEAVEREDTLQDEWRYLTEKGRKAAEKMSAAVARHADKPRLTITSPLTRAVQTTEIMAARAGRKNVVVATHLLMPGANTSEIVEHLKECGDAGRVMLVGHEPQLGSLVATLLGRADGRTVLKKGGCVALKVDPDMQDRPAEFLWYMVPGEKPVSSFKKAFPEK